MLLNFIKHIPYKSHCAIYCAIFASSLAIWPLILAKFASSNALAFPISVSYLILSFSSSAFVKLYGTGIQGSYFNLLDSTGLVVDSVIANGDSLLFDNLYSGVFNFSTNHSGRCSVHNQEIIILEPENVISNFITGELASALNKSNLAAVDMPLEAKQLSHLLRRLIDSTISAKIAKDIFAFMWEEALNGKEVSDVDQIIESRGLKQITDSAALGVLIDTVLQANTKSVEEFRAGKEKAFNALVGRVMKASQGKANPQQLNELLRQKLQSS